MTAPPTPRLYPAFSPSEMARRRRAVQAVMAEHGVDYLVVYGANRFGSAVQWLCGWPVTQEAALLVAPGERDLLLVQFYNHVPNARELAPDAEVRWGGPSTFTELTVELGRRGPGRVGFVGPLTYRGHAELAALVGELSDLNPDYIDLRLIKSAEEIAWLRLGAELSDRTIEAIRSEARPGITELDLAALVEGAYLAAGGTNHIHYFGVTSMEDPSRCVPAQYPSSRPLRPGDVLFVEISASYWGYPGQVLRSFTIGADPSPLYRELHEVADAAFDAVVACLRDGTRPQEVIEAASVIEEAGFTIYDDLVHGFGGGYLPPVLGTRSRPGGP
ncbi:MAG: M24 family metallopeptidase, partial [Acidimicrobiia bacterium]